MAQPKILIIDDDHDILLTARMFLEQLEFDVTVLSDPEKTVAQIRKEHFDVILLDMNFQRGKTEGAEGIKWLETIREHDPRAIVILMTAFGDVAMAWRLLDMAVIAHPASLKKGKKNDFYRGKVLQATYFVDTTLPHTLATIETCQRQGREIVDIEDNAF